MSLAYRELRSGLVVAEDAMDEAALGRALKQIDRRLALQKHQSDSALGGWVYKVVCVISDSFAPIVYTHADEFGTPLPLTSALIDGYMRHRADAVDRHRLPDSDERNRRHTEAVRRLSRSYSREIVQEHRARLERSQTQVSFSNAGRPGYGKGRVRPRSNGLNDPA